MSRYRDAENATPENDGPDRVSDMQTQDLKVTDQLKAKFNYAS